MQTLLIAGTALAALVGADAAAAGQRVVQRGPGMGYRSAPMTPRPVIHPAQRPAMHRQVVQHHVVNRPAMPPRVGHQGPRWGSKVGGRWWGGVNAPGGWNGYRRPVRGYVLPTYWNSPRFFINDWSIYGLQQPSYGYHWVCYYDDAVMIDGRGSIHDHVGNVDWDRYDTGDYGYDDDRVYAPGTRSYDDVPVAPDYSDDRDYDRRDDRGYQRRDNGVGGALAGAAVGGVAGALIGGRGDRLGGALIGGGVGALAGLAIDKAEDRGRRAPPPAPRVAGGFGADYPPPAYAPAPQHRYGPAPVAPGGHWVSPDGATTVVTSAGGYGGGLTTITVQSAPVVTTTVTEIYEDNVTWSRPKVAKRKVWKPRRKATCVCG